MIPTTPALEDIHRQAARVLVAARARLDLTARAYDQARRDGHRVGEAHRVWALALREWVQALTEEAAAADAARSHAAQPGAAL